MLRASDKQRELTNFMESLESDSLRTAWMFAFLCFPKTPSERNTDYRLLLLNKILQSGHTESKFHPLDITGNDKQIEKFNIINIGRSVEIEEIKKAMLANNTVLVYGIGGIGKSYICRKLFWDYHDSFSDGIEYLAWIQYNGDLIQSVTSSFYDPETNFDNIRKKYEGHPGISDMFVKLALSDKPDDKMQVIKEYFSKLEARLLVFIDNADIKKNAVIVHAASVAKVFKDIENKRIAIFLNYIAKIYRYSGVYKESMNYYILCLEILEKVLGTEHPDTANLYNEIGIVYKDSGNYEKALEYYLKSISIREKVLGTEHPDTATSYC